MLVGPGLNPPSTAISRGVIPSRSSSATVQGKSVSSAGLPSCVDAGRISPRAPVLACSVTSASWETNPNSLGYADICIAQPVPIPRLCRYGVELAVNAQRSWRFLGLEPACLSA